MNWIFFMATVSLDFLSKLALEEAQFEASGVVVTVVMRGGDSWDTGEGSVERHFEITLQG